MSSSKDTGINIEGIGYPVNIEGQGAIPCLCIGIGSLMQRTLSAAFKKIFTVYSVDLYFVTNSPPQQPETLNMGTLVNDVMQVVEQLAIQNIVLLAHSCFGILALEVAKRHHPAISGIIMVASAPQWNQASLALTNEYFDTQAEPERIAEDKKRKQQYTSHKRPSDSEVSIEKYLSDTARYWGDVTVSDELIRALWQGITVNDAVLNQFFETILPNHDLAYKIDTITVPVILFAGERDFDSIPLLQWENYPKPQHFTLINCGPIGHWPNLEAPALFDASIQLWLPSLPDSAAM